MENESEFKISVFNQMDCGFSGHIFHATYFRAVQGYITVSLAVYILLYWS